MSKPGMHAEPQLKDEYKNNTLLLIFSFVFSSLYASSMLLFPMEGVIDRANYLEMAEVSPLIFARYLGFGILSVFTNEPIWLLFNSALGLVLSPENVVRIIVFLSAFVTSYLLLKNNPKAFLFLIFVIVVPQVAKNYIVHIRQGMAIAVFLMAWYSKNVKLKVILFLVAPLVHASFFIVGAILFACYMLNRLNFAFDLRIFGYVGIGLFFGIGLPVVSGILGARQSKTLFENYEADGSGAAFLVWLLIFFFVLMQGSRYLKNHGFSVAMITFYLLAYFVSPIAGRVFESALPLVVLSLYSLTSWRKLGALSLFVMFSILTLLMRVGQPLLGFAEP